jgi:tetratricopeptide (TPR) repeat protein
VVAVGGARRESLLNQTICLTNATRYDEAVRTANLLIDAPGILRGEAFYWRSLNQYYLKALPSARAGVESAKPLYDDAVVYALSGFIAYDMGQKEYAYTEFGEAWRRNRSYCTAPFYQGRIDAEADRWAPAVPHYEAATACYETEVRRAAFNLEHAEQLDASDPTRDRRVKAAAAALDGARLQVAHAAYNVAYTNGRLGRAAAAIPFAEKAAAAHKDMETLANELLALLRKGG